MKTGTLAVAVTYGMETGTLAIASPDSVEAESDGGKQLGFAKAEAVDGIGIRDMAVACESKVVRSILKNYVFNFRTVILPLKNTSKIEPVSTP